ncbi:MAG: hypothetical protein WCJ69_00410 [Betaproteobacteria bacterium]
MSIGNLALVANILCSLVAALLLIKIWRRDVFFAIFFSFLVLYSIVPIWGYLAYPELSGIVLGMYFGVPPLTYASGFTLLSLSALYVAYRLIYRPISRPVRFDLKQSKPLPGVFIFIAIFFSCILASGYGYYEDVLSYANASDDEFLLSAGLSYKIFWLLYKFSTFILLTIYALIRSKAFRLRVDRIALRLIAYVYCFLFFLITVRVGSRTDPLALALGILAYEYYFRRFLAGRGGASNRMHATSSLWKAILKVAGFSLVIVAALTLLEIARNGGAIIHDDLETSAIAQAFLLKDYYWPFHVLIGAIAHNYIDPAAAIASNVGNALMFIGVDYLQSFVVEQWAPGSVTRTASPAMYAFTEGFVMLGWLGFIYNGVVWALGITLWRLLSRSNDEMFNALSFAATVAVAATVARTQSSYFVKDIYLWFLPTLSLYAIATGVRLKGPHMKKLRAHSGAQIATSR